jgi:hypothetical protein
MAGQLHAQRTVGCEAGLGQVEQFKAKYVRRELDLLIDRRAVPVGKIKIPWQPRPAFIRPCLVVGSGEWLTRCPGAAHDAKPRRLVVVAGRDLRHAVGVEFTLGMFDPLQAPHGVVDGLNLRRGQLAQRLVQVIAEVFLAFLDPAPAQRVAVT